MEACASPIGGWPCLPAGAPPHCAAIRIRNVAVGTTKKSTEARSATWFWRKVRQVCEGGFGRHPRPWSSTNASSPQDTRWSAVETHRRVAERRGPKGRGVVAPRRRDPARRGHFPAAGERLSARGAGRVIRAGRETAAEGPGLSRPLCGRRRLALLARGGRTPRHGGAAETIR